MSQKFQNKIKDKIQEDISPTRNLSGAHLKIVLGIAILWTFFQLWYASPFPFWFNFGMFKVRLKTKFKKIFLQLVT